MKKEYIGKATVKLSNSSSPVTELNDNNYVPYQLCPKCHGQGIVSKPSYVLPDVLEWTGTAVAYTCDVCGGAKIIPMAKL